MLAIQQLFHRKIFRSNPTTATHLLDFLDRSRRRARNRGHLCRSSSHGDGLNRRHHTRSHPRSSLLDVIGLIDFEAIILVGPGAPSDCSGVKRHMSITRVGDRKEGRRRKLLESSSMSRYIDMGWLRIIRFRSEMCRDSLKSRRSISQDPLLLNCPSSVRCVLLQQTARNNVGSQLERCTKDHRHEILLRYHI